MAVDTRGRRFSMLNFGDGTHIQATFEADGSIDLDDRQHLLDCYSGIAFGGGVPPVAAAQTFQGFIANMGKMGIR